MTESEIMKALECCKAYNYDACSECPFNRNADCAFSVATNCLDLINRKNDEIKQKDDEIDCLTDKVEGLSEVLYEAKAEAIKEFAERVKDEMKPTLFALFVIGEILVDVSKSHISSEKAFDDMREVLSRKGVIPSRFRFEKFLDQIAKEMGVEL